MHRRGFEQTLQSLKASLREHAAIFLEGQGLSFDHASYDAQASFQLDDVAREMLFFGAKMFPSAESGRHDGSLSAAA